MFCKKTYCLFLACASVIFPDVRGQNQKIADSLASIYQQNSPSDTQRCELLTDLAFHETRDLGKGLQYTEELITLAQQIQSDKYLRMGYSSKGTKKRLLGHLDEALEAYFKSVEIARRAKHLKGEGEGYGAIADIYNVANNFPNAMHYYDKGIPVMRQVRGDSINLASVILHAGEAYLKEKKYDSALIFFNEAKVIFEKINYPTGTGYSLGNIGMIYAGIGRQNLAEENFIEAIRILEETQDYYPVCVYLIAMCDIDIEKGDNQQALYYASRSLDLAERHRFKEQIADASLRMSQLYDKAGNINEAFTHYKKHVVYRDSVNNIPIVQKMADERTNYEISQRQVQVDMLKREKKNQRIILISLFVILGLTIMLLGSVYWFYKSKAKEKLRLHQQELLHAKLEIQEQTYLNISQELHDNIGQVLSIVKMTMNTVNKMVSDAAKDKIAESVNLLSKAIQDIRDISKTLNTDFLSEIGLTAAIDQQLQILKRTGLYSTELTVRGSGDHYQPEKNLLIFRVVQELLNNIVKHANADKIVVSINYESEKMVIRVQDNGKGFDPELQRSYPNKGLGLRNIHNRLKLIKGSISFQSETGKGTLATIEIRT